jgi:dGTPase
MQTSGMEHLGDSDFYRTRLTHSMEVAQIGVSLLKQIREKATNDNVVHLPPSELILVLGLSHDLGHPPFGHGGEVALNYCMRDHGGFEGNGQSLRIAAKLEKFSLSQGYDFTRRSLLGLLKYPVTFTDVRNPQFTPKLKDNPGAGVYFEGKSCFPPKCIMDSERDVLDFIFQHIHPSEKRIFQSASPSEHTTGKHKKSVHKSLDCSLMDLADDISYGVHDLEDAIAMNLIDRGEFRRHCGHNVAQVFLDNLKARYPDEFGALKSDEIYEKFLDGLFDQSVRKRHISRLVHFFVSNVKLQTLTEFQEPLFALRAELPGIEGQFLKSLKDMVKEEVVYSPHVQHLEFKGQQMVVSVFTAIANAPERFLPTLEKEKYLNAGRDLRIVCDYIAGMTDSFLLRLYERLFSPRMGSLFDRL